jgi:TPP-dependent pyruvate/acetoin dehydrogenase alpha subunit
MGDIDIRPKEEIEMWGKKDPITDLETRMISNGVLSGSGIEDYRERVAEAVEEAIDFARSSPPPKAEVGVEHVYVKFP